MKAREVGALQAWSIFNSHLALKVQNVGSWISELHRTTIPLEKSMFETSAYLF